MLRMSVITLSMLLKILQRTFFLSRQSSVEESQEGCVMAEVFIAQQTFQDSLSDPRAKAWATQR